MNAWVSQIGAHGYLILFAAIFLEAVGFPVPAALALLIAGGATAHGSLYGAYALGGALAAMLVGDTLMFTMGRYTGWWLLGILCRVSVNPEGCILRAADAFYRRGRTLLVIAKFIPGINTMAPPLAGCMNMRVRQFLVLDLAGAVLYIGAYFAVGYLLSDALGALTRGYQFFGRIVTWLIVAAVVIYFALQLWHMFRERGTQRIVLVGAAEAAAAIAAGASIYDVRSHGYLDSRAVRIRGSLRLDPHSLHQNTLAFPTGQTAYVYCTCVREATSARVARELVKNGVTVAVLKGGLRAWRRAGLPVEGVPPEELAVLPVFG